jgi:hypothetical protein
MREDRPRSFLHRSLFIRGKRVRFIALTVLTLKSAVARDFHGGTKGLSDEMARRPVIGRIPVHSLVLDLVQGGQPASPCAGSRFWAGSGSALASLHLFGFSASNLPKGCLEFQVRVSKP